MDLAERPHHKDPFDDALTNHPLVVADTRVAVDMVRMAEELEEARRLDLVDMKVGWDVDVPVQRGVVKGVVNTHTHHLEEVLVPIQVLTVHLVHRAHDALLKVSQRYFRKLHYVM